MKHIDHYMSWLQHLKVPLFQMPGLCLMMKKYIIYQMIIYLEHMTANNSDVFSKKQIDGIKYYYAVEDVVKDLEYRSLR